MHYDDGCFACGRDNPLGLNMDDFDIDDGVVSAQFTPRPDFRGVEGILHGGVAATALDEILVWAGILTEKVMSVTGTMDMKFRRPVRIDDAITARARLDERRGRRLMVSGELVVDDEVRVQASGLYLVTSDLVAEGVF
jgi:uncharacterized protein (TIGR00369 family)